MRRMVPVVALAALAAVALFSGCPNTAPSSNAPTFSLAYSDYPSWSVYGVAAEKGLIDGEKGKQGSLEKKWNVDIELKLLGYNDCINAYDSKKIDGVCITNMDALNPALNRKSVAVIPTSTSAGADALIVVGVADLDDLKKHKVYGLKESVSDYAFTRLVEVNKGNPKDYTFENLEPETAARNMQAKQKETSAIMVWNPMLLQTLRSRPDAKVLFDSSQIPEEIIDMVVVGQDSLDKTGGKDFACCAIDAFYEFNRMLNYDGKRDRALLVDLGKKFSSLDADDMNKCCDMTKFYSTADKGMDLFKGEKLPQKMDVVVKNYKDRNIIKGDPPKLGFGSADKAKEAQLRFDPTYMQAVKDKK